MKRSIETSSDYNNTSSISSYSLHSNNKKSLKRIRLEHEIFDKSIKDIEEMFLLKKREYAYDCINKDFLEEEVYPPANITLQSMNIPILPSQRKLNPRVLSLMFDEEETEVYNRGKLEDELDMIDMLVSRCSN